MLMNYVQSALWAVLWAITIWSTANSVAGLIYFIKGEGDRDQLLDALTNNRNLASICWAILIVFWWH